MGLDFLQMLGVGAFCIALVIVLIQRRAAHCSDHSPLAGGLAWILTGGLLGFSAWALWPL